MAVLKEWCTLDEAAEYLGVSKRTVYKWSKEGRLHPDDRRLPRNADYPYLTNILVEDFSYLAPEDFARFAGSSDRGQ